jgi:hypothetical protein
MISLALMPPQAQHEGRFFSQHPALRLRESRSD